MSAYKIGDERNCRNCQQPIYFGGAAWWHKYNESAFCARTGPKMDRGEPELDEVERVRIAAPDMYEALKECEWSDGGGCPQCAATRGEPHQTACILGNALAKACGK